MDILSRNTEDYQPKREKNFLIHILCTSTVNDEIDLHLILLLLAVFMLCKEGFLFIEKKNSVMKDRIPKRR